MSHVGSGNEIEEKALGRLGEGGNISRAHPELKGKLFLLILNTTNLGFKIFIPTLKLGMYNKV